MTDLDDNRLRKDARRLSRLFRRYPDALYKQMRDALNRSGFAWRGQMLQRMRAPLPEPGEPNKNTSLHTRTGRLRGSLRVEVGGGNLNLLTLTLASRGVPYAAVQEFGGTIKPRTRKWLTEPRKAALTPAGVLRKSAARYFQEDPKSVFIVELSGGLYIVKKKRGSKSAADGKEKFDILFRLRKQSTIPGPTTTGARSRFGFFDTWEAGREQRRKVFDAAISTAVKQAQAEAGGA